jgi:3-deoxy-D-manno-octulosonic-acid transferase
VNVLWSAYRGLAPVVGAFAPAASVFTSPAERVLWRERLGHLTRPGGCDAWVHAASLGEAVAAVPLVRELLLRQPEARLQLTATTRSGRARLAELDRTAALAPLDTPQAVRRFFHGVAPERLFLIETELWPHWLLRARRQQVPVAVVSARLSERSARRYARLGGELRALVGGLGAVLCQGEEDQQRWLALGAASERTRVVGNLKSDGLPEPAADRAAERETLGLERARPLLVLGNVRPGEARLLVRAWRAVPAALRAAWQVVAVPRHPRALAQIQAEAIAAGLTAMEDAAASDAWRWDGRLGVLTRWYRAADVAFVGGSLAPYGGHNPMEPAACGAAVLIGPWHATQREGVKALEAAGGIWCVTDAEALTAALDALLERPDLRAARGAAALRVAGSERGSAARAARELEALGLWPVR